MLMPEEPELLFPWLGRLLQVSDSAFPTGGYAHSYGLEQVVQFGLVWDENSLSHYLQNHVWPMLMHFELPVIRFAQEATREADLSALIGLAQEVEATKSARELREASRSTGQRRLYAFRQMSSWPLLEAFVHEVEEGRVPPHHAVVYGMGLAALPPQALLTSWSFQVLSAVCLSAPKLFRIGQEATQRVLTRALLNMEIKVAHALEVGREEWGFFDPVVEIASMQHEIAYERLFIS
jgi:urease accessory protein